MEEDKEEEQGRGRRLKGWCSGETGMKKKTSGFTGSPEGPTALETFLQETAGPSACSPVKSFWVSLELHLRVFVLSFLHVSFVL